MRQFIGLTLIVDKQLQGSHIDVGYPQNVAL